MTVNNRNDLLNCTVKNCNSVTIFRLTCFGPISFPGCIYENIAARSLPNVPAFFAMFQKLKLQLVQPIIRDNSAQRHLIVLKTLNDSNSGIHFMLL